MIYSGLLFPVICTCGLSRINRPVSAEEKIVPAKGKALIDTQISIAVPAGTYGRVAPRSGLGMLSLTLFLSMIDLVISVQIYD